MQSVNCRSETGGLGRRMAGFDWVTSRQSGCRARCRWWRQMFETALCKFLPGARRSTQRMATGNAGRGVEYQSVRPVRRAVGEGAGAGDSAVAGEGRAAAGGRELDGGVAEAVPGGEIGNLAAGHGCPSFRVTDLFLFVN